MRKDVGVAEVGCPGCLVVVGELMIDGNVVVCCDGYAIVNRVVGSGVVVELVGIAFVSWFGVAAAGINSSSASSLLVGLTSLLLSKMMGAGSAQIDDSLVGVGVDWIVGVAESASSVLGGELFTCVLSVLVFGPHGI